MHFVLKKFNKVNSFLLLVILSSVNLLFSQEYYNNNNEKIIEIAIKLLVLAPILETIVFQLIFQK